MKSDDAHAHTERVKSHTANSTYSLGLATESQAMFWFSEDEFEVSRAADVFEKIRAAKGLEECRVILRSTDEDELEAS